MKPPRPTVRTLMVLILLAALASYADDLRRRSEAFRAESERHDAAWQALLEQDAPIPPRADHHHAMKWKYRLAARRPWLPIEPDPPMPR